MLPPNADFFRATFHQQHSEQAAVEDSDAEEIEDATLESEPESEVDEDLSLEMDDGRNANKVRVCVCLCFEAITIVDFSQSHINEQRWKEIVDSFVCHLQKDEMDMEHLATLERLRQSQRQDYLKVRKKKNNIQIVNICIVSTFSKICDHFVSLSLFLSHSGCISAGKCIWVSAGNGSPYERITWYLPLGIIQK